MIFKFRPVLKGLAQVIRAVRPDTLTNRGDSESVHTSGEATAGALQKKPIKKMRPQGSPVTQSGVNHTGTQRADHDRWYDYSKATS